LSHVGIMACSASSTNRFLPQRSCDYHAYVAG
jgi:hypothetical protein